MTFKTGDRYRTTQHRGKITVMALFTDGGSERATIKFWRKDRPGYEYRTLKTTTLQGLIII